MKTTTHSALLMFICQELVIALRESVRIRSCSGPYFPAFSISLRIQSKCRKIRTTITPNTDTFYAVLNLEKELLPTLNWNVSTMFLLSKTFYPRKNFKKSILNFEDAILGRILTGLYFFSWACYVNTVKIRAEDFYNFDFFQNGFDVFNEYYIFIL